MELNQYGRVVIAFLVGLVLGVGGTLGLGRVNEFISGGNDPMASVSTVSNKLPNLVTPPVVVTRLEKATDTKWNIERFSNGVKFWGGKPLTSAAERIRAKAALPPVADGDVSGVFTNLFDDDSVAENGAIYMIWFGRPPLAEAFFRSESTVFVDEDLEKKRDSYWSGGFAVFYSPGRIDQTDGLRTFLKQLPLCMSNLQTCPIPPDVKAFDDWAPRAED